MDREHNVRAYSNSFCSWACCAAVVLIAYELWQMIDPVFLDNWKEDYDERMESEGAYPTYQFYAYSVIGTLFILHSHYLHP